ncbi:MAG: SpoIIE family protein phosphatase [Spirochaetales bacterium]|uniref:SpoIIE family protein phosphatase n=1 Tax=Candidatus Thalassospirochaeta sargassi TaxID=3119039 RepID=A0AAJ1IG56_9SPIO|nr:SpoIIE family protein phosphatase [Spirochaetales bacterium]
MTEKQIKTDKHLTSIILGSITPRKVHGMGIGKIASAFSYTLEDTKLVSIADKLETDDSIQAVGVVNKKGKALGIVTRKDLFGILSRPFGRDVLRKKTVSSLISDVECFNVDDNIFTVSEEIEEKVNGNSTHFFLLINDNDEFCGIFSGKDMLVFLAGITRQDIALSRKIQTRIVKEEDELKRPNFNLSASSIMAKGIGGDFYSFKKFSESHYLIVLCDVSGKGMAASLLSSLLSGFINTYPIGTDLKGMITDLNLQLTQSFAGEKFITGVFMIFNEETGQLQIADMGHTHYMLYTGGKNRKIENSHVNIPLGISTDINVRTFNLLLKTKDCFFLMTDGITEQKNENGELYSYDRINSVFRSHQKISANGLRARLLSDFDDFRGAAARQDDISFIILKYSPDLSKPGDGQKDRKANIEDKIKWALSSGKPIQVKTNRYLPEDRDFIDSVLDRFLNEAGIKFLMNKVSYCVHELATNAKKANTKRVYFKSKELNINNPTHYEEGMRNFKTDTIEKIDYYLEQQKKQGYFIVIMFQLTQKALRVSVVNNSEMTESEKVRVAHKIKIAGKSTAIGDIYDQIEDYSEGAGLGIVMMSQMLRTMGFGPDALTINSEGGLTTSSILINLRE